jgi:hypothetical protein
MVAGLATGTLALVLLGIAVGLAVPSARAAQAIGLVAFFPPARRRSGARSQDRRHAHGRRRAPIRGARDRRCLPRAA